MEPLVTAVIVTHNRKALLEKAIQSVLRQTWPALRLIVVDDGSRDGTEAWLSAFAPEHGIDYVRLPESRGANAARNLGIRRASGAYVALLDDDDEWFPEKTARQVALLEAHPDMGVAACGKTSVYDFTRREVEPPELLPEGDLSQLIFTDLHFTTSRLMVRRSLLLEVGGFDEALPAWQDYELMIRLCQRTRVGVVRENLLLYNIVTADPARITNRLPEWQEAVTLIHKKHRALLEALPPETRKAHRLLVCREGAKRADRAGDPKAKRAYLKEALLLEPSGEALRRYLRNEPVLPVPSLPARLRAAAGKAARSLGLRPGNRAPS